MVAQNRFHQPDTTPVYSELDGWMISRYAPLSIAEMDDLRGRAVRAGIRGAALIVFMVLLYHTDCLGAVSGRVSRLASDANVKPDAVTKAIHRLQETGQVDVVRPGKGRRRPLWHIAGLRWTP